MERKDHFSPQVYLRGFIDPAKANDEKPLSVFVLARTRWEKKSPSQIGWRRGFESMTDPDLEHQLQKILQDSENRSEEHTSELQSHHDLVCRLLLEKKKKH